MYNSFLTYGFELELADVDRRTPLPFGCEWSRSEVSTMNSNGEAVHSYDDSRPFGGEINTPPTRTIPEQISILRHLFGMFPNSSVNHRCIMNLHIGFVNLREVITLDRLKRILVYVYDNFADTCSATLKPNTHVNKRTNHPQTQMEYFKRAKSFAEIEDAFYRDSKHKKSLIVFKRRYVNVHTLFKYGTLEFRCFWGTKDLELTTNCFLFSKRFVLEALGKHTPVKDYVGEYRFPPVIEFDKRMEDRFRVTKSDAILVRNISRDKVMRYKKAGRTII